MLFVVGTLMLTLLYTHACKHKNKHAMTRYLIHLVKKAKKLQRTTVKIQPAYYLLQYSTKQFLIKLMVDMSFSDSMIDISHAGKMKGDLTIIQKCGGYKLQRLQQ